jgi:hypothetical protein
MEWMKKLLTNANLPVIFLKEKGQFVAYTPALDLSESPWYMDASYVDCSRCADHEHPVACINNIAMVILKNVGIAPNLLERI